MELNKIETNLSVIATKSLANQNENNAFIEYLSHLNSDEIDEAVFKLNTSISPHISCTDCGNCCKTLMVNIDETEADIAAKHLKISRTLFDKKYIERAESGKMLINQIPCHFLDGNKCSIYESRFSGCKEFPALDLPFVKRRLFTIFMHYDRCPIIFNVMEELKKEVRFV